MLWLTINRADKGNAIPYYVRDRLIAALLGRALRPRRCARSCSPRRASGTSAPAPTSRSASRPASRSPRARPTWSSGGATHMMRARLPAAHGVDARLREADHRRAQRHRGRRRRDVRARRRPRDRGRHRQAHPGVRAPRARSPTAASPTCCRASSACTRRRSSSSSATTSPRPTPSASGSSTRSCPPPSCEAAAKEWAERLASGPTKAIGWAKQLLHDASELSTGATCSTKRRCSSRSTAAPQDSGEGVAVVPRAARAGVEGLVSRMRAARQGPHRGRRHRADRRSARGCPTPSCRSRARRSRSRSTTRASRRRRSTGSRRTRWSRTARSTSPATSGSATSRSSRRSASAAARAAAWSATRRWRSRPGSARSWSRGGPASAPSAASRPWAQAPARLADDQQWSRPFGHHPPGRRDRDARPAATCTSTAATRDHLANVAIAFRKHAARNPASTMGHKPLTRDDVHERALDLRAAVPVRQLPRDRRRARGGASRRPSGRAISRTRPRYIHSFAQGLPPQHQTMTNYFTDDPLRGPAWTAARRLWANADVDPGRRAGRAALRRVQPADPAVARGLRLLRARRGRPVHRRRQHRVARRPAARRTRRAAACRRRTCTASTSSSKACARSAAPTRRRSRARSVSLVTSGEGVPTSRDPLHEETGDGNRSGCSPTSTSRRAPPFWAGLRARRAARAGVRVVRACAACRPGRCARAAGRSTCAGSRRRVGAAIWSFIVPHPPLLPAFAELAPYNAIIVELEEDPADPLRRQPRRPAPTARSTRSTRPRSRSASRCSVVFHQIDDVSLPRWVRAEFTCRNACDEPSHANGPLASSTLRVRSRSLPCGRCATRSRRVPGG